MSSPPHSAALSPKHFLSLPRPSVPSNFKDDDYLQSDLSVSSFASSSSSSQRLNSVTTVDTSTLAAHDFDVDDRTGFMPPCPPLPRLPSQWEDWEVLLDDARSKRLQLGGKRGLTEQQMRVSEEWRECVKKIPIISIEGLTSSEDLLRRAHHVLAWVMHFFINTLPLSAPIIIPPPISIPIIQVSEQLALPPILTYSDDVLYNWTYKDATISSNNKGGLEENNETNFDPLIPQFESLSTQSSYPIPKVNHITPLTTFTDTVSERAFYLASSHSELTGSLSLQYMSHILDEAFILDILALRRISHHLSLLADNIDAIRQELDRVKEDCDPDTFFWEIRPWFKGCDSMEGGRRWVFDGVGEHVESVKDFVSLERYEEYRRMRQPRLDELSGPSAAQSSLIHVIDIFLGVEKFSHRQTSDGSPALNKITTSSSSSGVGGGDTFLKRMQTYMPRHHRLFLSHLSTKTPHIPIRTLIETQHPLHPELGLRENYNKAVEALKRFRDAHLKIVALYIVGPARRVAAGESKRGEERDKSVVGGTDAGMREEEFNSPLGAESALERKKEKAKKDVLKGTGGTNLVPFLKGVRDLTASAVLP